MSLENLALAKTDDFPIRHEGDVHSGKVRSVYWLNEKDSDRLRSENGYNISEGSQIGVMIISDRISAFDCNWIGENGLDGVPGKGAALNVISSYWFDKFNQEKLARNHILDSPHPLVWMVQRAQPILIEAIARNFLTGSMLRDYENGQRKFGETTLPDGLKPHQKLPHLLITPSTKRILKGIPGIPEEDDVNITRQQIIDNYKAFGFQSVDDVLLYEKLSKNGFDSIERRLNYLGQIFVDTKFEFGYVTNDWRLKMIYIDEVGTPDSSRIWDAEECSKGKIIENSKEGFRQYLLRTLDRDILLNKKRMNERKELAKNYPVPVEIMMEVSNVYAGMAERITGKPISKIKNARQEIIESLSGYGVIG